MATNALSSDEIRAVQRFLTLLWYYDVRNDLVIHSRGPGDHAYQVRLDEAVNTLMNQCEGARADDQKYGQILCVQNASEVAHEQAYWLKIVAEAAAKLWKGTETESFILPKEIIDKCLRWRHDTVEQHIAVMGGMDGMNAISQ